MYASLYKLIADYHTYTRYSHGRDTILGNVEAARTKGLKTTAITDHSFNHTGFGISISDLTKIRRRFNRKSQILDLWGNYILL